MQPPIKSLLFFLALILFFSCKKDDVTQTPPIEEVPVGVPTPIGTPVEETPIQVTIGAAGGSINSGDGRLKVTVPAGALTSSHDFSVQIISNHNPLAVGDAYRIAPHDVQFAKPVTIEFSYGDEDIINTIPEALGIAYQDSNRVWQAQGGAVIDKQAKTVKLKSTHFSDWSLFESIYMISSRTAVHVSETAELEVFTTEDLLVPLNEGEQVAMGKKVSMAAKYIKEWKLAGAGTLQPDGSNAVYKAPSVVPASPNPVAVSVSIDLKKRGTFLLVRHIEIVDDNGEIEIQVAGSALVKKTASPAVMTEDGYYVIGDSDGDTQGSYVLIMVPGELGTHPYRSPESNSGTYVHYLVTGANSYVCQYMEGDDLLLASGGGVTVTDLGEEDGFLKGTFQVNPAGYGDFLRNTVNIEGKFRVKIATGQQ